MFEYDHLAPLQVAQAGAVQQDGAWVHEISYQSPMGGRVEAYLVMPDQGVGPFAGLLYMHPGQGSKSTYLAEAVVLAGAGIASLLIDAPYLRPEYRLWGAGHLPTANEEADLYRQLVLDLRRGVDLLAIRPDVDAARIGYVGHSLGATWGGPLAAAERRIRAFVLMAGFGSLTEWYRHGDHPLAARFRSRFESEEQMESYLAVLAPMDAVAHIGQAQGAAFFFQNVHEDPFVPIEEAVRYVTAAPEPKIARWYDGDHLFTGLVRARLDRARWLAERLELGSLPPAVAARLEGLQP
ncbi:MAG: alpha/beta hydrolase family protein [Bacillota bacterium]